jgi:hypothetical protein
MSFKLVEDEDPGCEAVADLEAVEFDVRALF